MTQGRGQLTDRVKAKAKELLGYEITLRELRLMPYLQYVMMNDQRMEPRKMNDTEMLIMEEWRNAGYIAGDASTSLTITQDFWNAMNQILFLAYVDIK